MLCAAAMQPPMWHNLVPPMPSNVSHSLPNHLHIVWYVVTGMQTRMPAKAKIKTHLVRPHCLTAFQVLRKGMEAQGGTGLE